VTHIAIIPARMGSQGFKFKNRKLFSYTADCLDKVLWIQKIIVSTDDPVVEKNAKERGYDIHKRLAYLAGPKISIKQVFESVIKDKRIKNEDILWLFYLPVLYKNENDFQAARKIIEKDGINSLCSFIPARSHPYNCWRYDDDTKRIKQYIPNDVFRRQDLPPAWMHYHYLCCFKVFELQHMNSELINHNTFPMFLSNETADQLMEVDTPEDYERWKRMSAQMSEEL